MNSDFKYCSKLYVQYAESYINFYGKIILHNIGINVKDLYDITLYMKVTTLYMPLVLDWTVNLMS